MSLFSTLNVANRGLTASQLGLDLTGQNIANASTEGYSRKRMTLSSQYRADGTYGQMGMGVTVENITRVRDQNIDIQIQRQNHQFGYYNEMDKALESVENILNEPSDTGIISYMDQFFDSWNNLVNNPSDSSARTMVKTAGQTLSATFQNISFELADLRASRNDEIKSTVDEINKMGREIYTLNDEIAAVELAGQNANDSRDRRDLLMKNLSELVDYDTIESDDGQLTITVGGNIFVSAVSFNELQMHADPAKQIDNSGYVQYGVRMRGIRQNLKINGGALKGLMDARDVSIPQFEDKIDQLAMSLVERINEQHNKGYNMNGYSGFDFFDPSTTGANDIAISASVLTDVNNIAAAGGGTQTKAITNTTAAGDMDFGNQPIQLAETLGRPWVTGDADSEKVTNAVNGTVSVKIASTGTDLVEGIDFAVNYANGTVQMLHNGNDGTAMNVDFSYTVGGFAGPGNNENAVELAQLREKLSMNPDYSGDFTTSFNDFYSGMVGELGLARNESISNKDTREYLIEQYMDSQEAVAGVSIDEEMSNLIKFQHTYQAAAKIVATTQQMLDILMNL